MGSFLDVLLRCISFACIAIVFRGNAFYCCSIIEKARMSSKEGITPRERLETAALLVVNLTLGAAGATLFYRGLYWFSDPGRGETLVADRTVDTLVAALARTIQEFCLIILWMLSVTACICWTFYTIAAIWEITVPCFTSTSGAVPDLATNETDIDLESQVGCTNQAIKLSAGDVVHVRNYSERPGIGQDTVMSGYSCAAPLNPREIRPQLQAERVSQLIWSAYQESSPSQSSGTAACTPSTTSYSGAVSHFDGHGQFTDDPTTTETFTFASVTIQHLNNCSWMQSVGDTWHDLEACERRFGENRSENEPAKDMSAAQRPIAPAQLVQTTSEVRIATILNNLREKISQNTSTATTTSETGTGIAYGASNGVVQSATGLVDNKTRSPCSSFAQHRFPDLPNGVDGNGRGRALTDPFKEYYANTTSHKDEQHIMSPLQRGNHTHNSFPPNLASTTPKNETTNQQNHLSPSNSSSTVLSDPTHSPPTPTAVSAPSSSPNIYTALPTPPSLKPLTPSRLTAWQTHVLAQEQKRYSQRLRFAIDTQYRHLRNSDLETDLQAALFEYSKRKTEERGM